MKLEYLILGNLKLNPGTGYDFKKFLDTEGRYGRARAPLSQIYKTLQRMANKGWLTVEEIPQDGKPDRKVYSVTPRGFEVLVNWLSAPHKPDFRFQDRTIMYKLSYSCFIDPAIMLEHLRGELTYRMEYIAKFRPRDRTVSIAPSAGVDCEKLQEVMDLLHLYGASALDLYIVWIKKWIEYFENQVKETEEDQ